MLINKLFILFLTQVSNLSSYQWDYTKHGPDSWPYLDKKCASMEQSPINIVKKDLLFKSSLLKINFYNYDKILNWNISYREYQIYVKPLYDSNLRIFIDGSDFNEIYELNQFHFHWGYNIYQGSEHQIDFEKFPLEVHLVHESKNGQLAVLAFLFRISNESKIQSFYKNIEFIDNANKFSILRFSLNSLIPTENSENLKSYFRYKGSLTIPPCNENVTWTVFNYKLDISLNQIKSAFHKNWFQTNFRVVQKLNDRNVFSSFCLNDKCAENQTNKINFSWYFILATLSLFNL